MAEPVRRLVEFGRALRREGLGVGTGAIADFCRASALLGPGELYWAGRATLVLRREEIELYDGVFRRFFGAEPEARRRPPSRPRLRLVAGGLQMGPPTDESHVEDGAPSVALASRVELLRRKTFARCTPEELAQLSVLAEALRTALPSRRSRRRRGARAGELDLARTLRRSLRTSGEPFGRRYRERPYVPRRLVLLLDVSGSMSEYSRALLVLAHGSLRALPRAEIFCFGTRLTRVTHALAVRDPDEALRRAAREVVDWEGGTRIGESVKAFLDGHGHRGSARGALVVLCSDGLDIGEADLLAEQMERLSRLAHKVVWLNPLKHDPAYEPLARGMQAALPFIDVFAGGHDLASLEQVGRELARAR